MPTDDVAVRLRLRDAAKFRRQAGQASSSIDRFGRSAKTANAQASVLSRGASALGKAMKTGLVLGVGAVGTELVRATRGWADHLAIVRRSEAVIKSTSGAANVTAKHVGNLSDAIERQTGVDGDLIQGGANLLLTFTNIRNGVGKSNKIFDQATSTAVNMSKALGQSTKTSAIQLGKALNDPVKGVSALSKVGVSFTQQQKDQIKTLVESGRTMDAQKMILRELNKEFPKVKATPFERLQVILRALEDTLGKVLLPIFNKGVTALNKFIAGAQNGTGAGGKFISAVTRIGSAVNTYLIKPLTTAVTWLRASNDRFTAFKIALAVTTGAVVIYAAAMGVAAAATALTLSPVILIIAAIGLLAGGLYYAYQRSSIFRSAVNSVWGVLKSVAGFVISKAAPAWRIFGSAIRNLPLVWLIRHFSSIVAAVKRLPGRISRAASGMWDGIKEAFKSALNWIIDKWNGLQFHIGGQKVFGHSLPSVTIGTPNIPRFALGGMVPGTGSGDTVPMLGTPGEFVVRRKIVDQLGPTFFRNLNAGRVTTPESLTRGDSGGLITVHIDQPIYLDGREIGRNVARRTENDTLRRR